MIILDLDIDYFIKKVAFGIPESSHARLSEVEYGSELWQEYDIREFLESKLHLLTSKRIKGRVVTHHNEAIDFWEELIKDGNLTVPFNVVHIDSHADLGLGTNGGAYLSMELLKHPVNERRRMCSRINAQGKSYKEGIGDYLLFAIAYGWIDKLVYCGNPNGECNDYDISILKDFKEKSFHGGIADNIIQLKYNPYSEWPNPYTDEDGEVEEYLKNCIFEPEIPFRIIRNPENIDMKIPFDYAVISQSPNYTPESADSILDIIKEYIEVI